MWLVGMMGSGKTTVGEKAAARIGVRFFDTDRMVMEQARMPVSDIWSGVGETGFRELERKAVLAVPTAGCVAAAGGGAVLSDRNLAHIARGAPVVWLRTSPMALASRLGSDGERPLLQGEASTSDRLVEILGSRAHIYESVATHTIDTDGYTIAETVDEVVRIWEAT